MGGGVFVFDRIVTEWGGTTQPLSIYTASSAQWDAH